MSTEKAILAGGCFWGVEESDPPVIRVSSPRPSGIRAGMCPTPRIAIMGRMRKGSRSIFDPEKLSYRKLLEFFFQIHDPTTRNRQGNDVGTSYRSAIFMWMSSRRKRRSG